MDLLVLVLEDRGLDRAVEELVGVPAEELVQRILARDVHREAVAAAPRAAPHLLQGGNGSGERHDDRRVQRADVDPELERVGRDDREQLAAHELALELTALLRRVAGAVGDDEILEVGVGEPDEAGDELDRLARLDEADRARALMRELGDDLGRLAERRRAGAERLVDERRVPHRDLALGAGRAVAVHQSDLLEPRQPLGELDRVGDGRAGEQEARVRAVGVGDPSQPAQHVRHVRSEHPAVDVRLVHDDDREVREEVAPVAVVGQDPHVEHVGVREHEVRAPADLRALLASGVSVVDRGAHLLDQAEGVDRARLVLGEGLRRIEVERAGLRVAAEDVERRQVEAQRLAGGGAGRDDRRPGPGRFERVGLMAVERVDPGGAQRVQHLRVQGVGEGGRDRSARPFEGLAHEPLVGAPEVEQVAPGLGVGGHRQGA